MAVLWLTNQTKSQREQEKKNEKVSKMCQKVAVSDLRFVVLYSFNLTKIRIQQQKYRNNTKTHNW
jgi:hypothetical protein